MGDCRLQVRYVGSLATELSVPDSPDETDGPFTSKSVDNGAREVSCWFISSPSADTTVLQVADAILVDLGHRLHRSSGSDTCAGNRPPLSFESGTSGSLILCDMTLNPPRNVTPTIASHSALTGPKSKTLSQLGWFPSARLAVCYERDIESQRRDTDAAQCIVDIAGDGAGDEEMGEYNRTKRLAVEDGARMVKLTGTENDESAGDGYRPKVSEMMAAIANRDTGKSFASVAPISEDSIVAERAKKVTDKRNKEARRTARLDDAIRQIDEVNEKSNGRRSKTNANISAQVKKMLIKSRAVGTKSLREEDKYYLEILFVDDTSTCADHVGAGKERSGTLSFHFFSRVAKVGSVASNSIAPFIGNDACLEVLVKMTMVEDNLKEYRRLPNLMALHEAEEQGYLHQFDRVVVRKYNTDDGGDSGPTKSVLDVDDEDASDSREPSTVLIGAATICSCTENDATDSSAAADQSLSRRISQAIEAAEISNSKGSNAKKKKKSSTSEKVRQMLIKGKAKGDKKAVKDHDRFYLQAIVVSEDSLTGSITANAPPAPYFFNRMASIKASILRAVGVAISDGDSVELYVRDSRDGKDDAYAPLEDVTMRLCDAEKISVLQQFSLVVAKQKDAA